MTKIAINGFGRIGRLVFRILQERCPECDVVAVNDLVPADNLAYLLSHDTVHRAPKFSVWTAGNALCTERGKSTVYSERDPTRLPWGELGVDVVIESTGLFTSKERAQAHRTAGAQRVLLTAPGSDIDTFVVGVNEGDFDAEKHHIISNASCTTNCLAPLAKILVDHFGIEEGLMTTIHALTATQPTVDGPSQKDWRGGRAAAYNIIPSSTGAAKAVALCLPAVKGKLTGMAFRVPTLDVSVVDLTVRLSRSTSYAEICEAVRAEAEGAMRGIVAYCDDDVVSSDLIGHTASCIFDVRAGIALNPHFYKLVAWYDNEIGYANRVVDLLRVMTRVKTGAKNALHT